MSNETQVKWEYLFAEEEYGRVFRVYGANESELYPRWHKRHMTEFTSWLGKEGWELVALTTWGDRLLVLAFKRRLRV
jgi:hypothetical protein